MSTTEIWAKFNGLTWKEEFRLQQRRDSSSQWAQDDLSPQIAKRNRYANIQPWSKSRIHLKVAEGESDYINASPVKLLNPQTGVETKYIVTQVSLDLINLKGVLIIRKGTRTVFMPSFLAYDMARD